MADNGQIANTAGLQADTGQGGNFSRGSCRGGIHLGGNRGGGPNRDMSNGSYTRQGAVGYWSGSDNQSRENYNLANRFAWGGHSPATNWANEQANWLINGQQRNTIAFMGNGRAQFQEEQSQSVEMEVNSQQQSVEMEANSQQQKQSSAEVNNLKKNRRDVTRTVIITKVKKELLSDKYKMVEKLAELGIERKAIDTISFTSASSCLIEFVDQDQVEKYLKTQCESITDNGNISKLTFTNQNFFVLICGTSTGEIEKLEKENATKKARGEEALITFKVGDTVGSNLEEIGIISIEALRSNYKDKSTGLIKAYCRDDTTIQNLITHGLKFNYQVHRVFKFTKRTTETVCYKCAGFNHMAIHCKRQEKCYKCSGDHAGYNCHLKGKTAEEQKGLYKCPACEGNHPLTYGKCPKRKEREHVIQSKPSQNGPQWHRIHSSSNQFQGPILQGRADGGVSLNEIMSKLCNIEKIINGRIDKLETTVATLLAEKETHIEHITENINRVDKLTKQVKDVADECKTINAKVDHLYEYTVRQLYKKHKGLQTENGFISDTQAFFNCNIDNLIGKYIATSTQSATNHYG